MESSSTKIQAQKAERMKEKRKRIYIYTCRYYTYIFGGKNCLNFTIK